MAGAYTFLWLSETGSVAGVDSVDCRDDDDAILGTRLVHQVQRREA
jgi:hypothetical protein